jgi:hypothetical protein
MIKNRFYYWNCSKFADFIRGEQKPYALAWCEWGQWKSRVKSEKPWRYWAAETVLPFIQDLIMFPSDLYYTTKVYIRNRWIDQNHVLKTGLKPGEYYDLDTKILHGLFTELVDLVEIEMAAISRRNNKKKYSFIKGRCEEAGLDYLDWASSIIYDDDYGLTNKDKKYGKPTPQAISAQKIRELYIWWKNVRPNRPDPLIVSGYTDSNIDDDMFDRPMDKKDLTRMKKCDRIEQAYYKEDNDKLIKLIKLRKYLWV